MVVKAQLLETFLSWSSVEKSGNETSISKKFLQSVLKSKQAKGCNNSLRVKFSNLQKWVSKTTNYLKRQPNKTSILRLQREELPLVNTSKLLISWVRSTAIRVEQFSFRSQKQCNIKTSKSCSRVLCLLMRMVKTLGYTRVNKKGQPSPTTLTFSLAWVERRSVFLSR